MTVRPENGTSYDGTAALNIFTLKMTIDAHPSLHN